MSTPQPIPLLDLRRPLAQTPGLRQSLIDAFERVLDGGQYILGDEVAAFERAAAAYCQLPYAVGTSSGTDALLLALMGLDIGPGDDVLCPTFTFFATAGSIARLGARPVFVDCCPGCYNMLPREAATRRTPNVRAVMPVHLFGQLADMAALMPWAKAHGLAVVEDAAQALGASSPAGVAGSIGTAGCFSFFPSKNLGALGDAGLVTTHDPQLADRLTVLRVHGGRPKYVHATLGGNFRIDALQAAMLQVKLLHLDAASAARAAHAARYDALFAASGLADTQPCLCEAEASGAPAVLGLPVRRPGRHIYNQYILRIGAGRRDAVRAGLAAAGIGTEIYYPRPLHLQPCFAHLGYRPGDFPHAEAAAQQTLALPIFAELQPDEIERIARTVVLLCGGQPPNC
jgi:dTDP-4-amino-4,6-dideoxygalactose transaminase